MKLQLTAAAFGLASFVSAQVLSSSTVSGVITGSRSLSSLAGTQTAAATGQACAQASSQMAQQSPGPYVVQASLANACQLSAPIVKQDALRLLDGIIAPLNFQSDIGVLKSPPAGYPLAGADLLGDLANLRSQVNSGVFTSEIAFERNLSAVLGKPHDGHLSFNLDGRSVFQYQRWIPGLISVSLDGTSLPNLYVYADFISYLEGYTNLPSAVVQINGQNASAFVNQWGLNVTYDGYQDPDAIYNSQLYVLNSGQGNFDTLAGFVFSYSYPGDNTTITFANSTTLTNHNYAYFNAQSFKGLVDGASYYNLYCNATRKALAAGYDINDSSAERRMQLLDDLVPHADPYRKRAASSSSRAATRTASATQTAASQTATQLLGYPSPVVLSEDLALSGYFLDLPGFTDTAVLVMQQMSEDAMVSFQESLTKFLDLCRSGNKKRLVIDIQGNPGGAVSLGFDIFKQLFPNVWPYGAGTLRAHEGLNTLGTFYTNVTSQVYAQDPNNITSLINNGYYKQWSAEANQNASGQLYTSWSELYGPVKTSKDNYTNLIRPDYNATGYNLGTGQIVVSGYANNSYIAPSPFTSDNIIILSDGRCSSTCTIMSHLLKWQGKVKTIAVGGRPNNGPMQSQGGIKGSQIMPYPTFAYWVTTGAQAAQQIGYTDQYRAFVNSPSLGPVVNDSNYIIFRGASAGASAGGDFGFNWENNIAEGDPNYTPLQFVYEAADCRLWFQPQHIANVENLWYTVAAQAFGLNNTRQYSLCVQGSTNASSSLSGNATLYNNGVPTNVTSYPQEVVAGKSGSGSNSGASQLATSGMAALVGFIALLFAL